MTQKPHPATAVLGMISIYSPNPRRLAAFWATLMSLPIHPDATDEVVMLDFDHETGPVTWIIQRAEADRGVAPVALDIGAEDEVSWRDVASYAETLGAERGEEHDVDGIRWVDMRDPDGNRFRVFAARPTAAG